MGIFPGHINGIMAEMTLQKLAEKSGGKYDTLYRKAKREFPTETWTADSVLLPEHIAVLSPKKSAGKSRKKSFNPRRSKNPSPPAPENPETAPARTFEWPAAAKVRTALFNILAVGVVGGHGFLIWQEAQELYGWLGSVGGAVVFTTVCLAVLICSDPAKNRTSEWALWFICLVDIAAVRVHFEALSRPDVPADITVGFCVFICACSFMALLLFRDSKLG